MSANSIIENMSKDTVISTIKLSLSADITKSRPHMIVEGDDDIKLLKKFKSSNVVIHQSYSGKDGVLEILQNPYIDDYRVIGIRDRDYCESLSHDRIFFYDMSCLEMMILNFDDAFNAIYCDFYDGKLDYKTLLNTLLKELYPLSMFRKYNEHRKLEINFKGLKLSKVLDSSLKIDYSKVVAELIRVSPNCNCNLQILYEEIQNLHLPENGQSYLNISNGHDFITLFREYCNSTKSNSSISDKQIASSLRASFNINLFKLTKLYISTTEFKNTRNLWEL